MAGGGKRIRPLLLLLSSKALGCTSHSRIRLGAVVEMLHTATLVHDDIIDEADTRRGRPSSNTTWGNAKCVLAGDWLYMQSFCHRAGGAQLPRPRAAHLAHPADGRGRAAPDAEARPPHQRRGVLRPHLSQDRLPLQRLHAARRRHHPAPATEIESQLGEYGRNLGLAFQIVDDVLDLTAAEDILGKPVASDLREGKATLAVIHALERGTGADREAIRTVLAERSFATVSHPQILEILERHGSLAYAMDTACAYAEAARLSIADLPDTEAKRALLWVPGFVTSRDR